MFLTSNHITQLEIDPPTLGGRRRGQKLIASINQLSRFRVGSVQSVQRVAGFYKHHRNLQKSRQNVQKLSTFAPKIVEISLDLLESRRISPNMVEISLKSTWISSNLTKNQLGSPWISLDFTKYGQDLAEISLDLLESRQISPNMVEISLDLLESELDLASGSGSGLDSPSPNIFG